METLIVELLQSIVDKNATTDERCEVLNRLSLEWKKVKENS